MKLGKKMIQEIRKNVRKVCGGSRIIEVGRRTWDGCGDKIGDGFNFLLWGSNNDLDETVDIDLLANVEIPEFEGFIALDLYCYTTGDDGELDRNCYVFLDSVMVIYCSDDDLGHVTAIDQEIRLRRPGSRYVPQE